jgi:twitching motility protein PilI
MSRRSKTHTRPHAQPAAAAGVDVIDVPADASEPDPSAITTDELQDATTTMSTHYEGMSAFDILDDYEQRSLAHVAGLPEQLDAPGLWRGVGFRIGNKRLAAGFHEVVEILPMPQVTPVPGAQPWLLGVANIRGNLLPIVDLKQFLEGERTVLHESQRVLIVRQPGGDVAVTIDELFGQRSFTDAQQLADETLAQSVLAQGRYAHFVDRAYDLADVPWGIFSLERLARTPEFRQAAA